MARNIDKAINLLLSVVNRKNYYSMAQYANMVFSHVVSNHLNNAFDILAGCVKKGSHYCSFVAATFFVRTVDDSFSGLLSSPSKFLSLGVRLADTAQDELPRA